MRVSCIVFLMGIVCHSAVLAETQAEKLLNEYCSLQKEIQSYFNQKQERFKVSMNSEDPQLKALDKKSSAASNKQMKLSTQYEKLKGTYLSSGDCSLKNAKPLQFASTPFEIKRREFLQTICDMHHNRENFPDTRPRTDNDFAELKSYYPKWFNGKSFDPKDCPY